MSEQLKKPTGVVFGDRVWPVVAGYGLVSDYYDEWYWQYFWMMNERPLIIREIAALGSRCSPALDVGTGTGLYLMELLGLGIKCVGVDACQAMLDEARRKLPPSIGLFCATVENLPFHNKEFNLITACRVLSHICDIEIAMHELGRVTNTDGRLILSDVSALHDYKTTRIPILDGDVHIETYKHSVGNLVEAAESTGYWKVDHVKSVTYKDLLWKPQPSEYPAIDASSARPIFFYGVLTRMKTD